MSAQLGRIEDLPADYVRGLRAGETALLDRRSASAPLHRKLGIYENFGRSKGNRI